MCDPVTILAISTAVVGATSARESRVQGKKAESKTKKSNIEKTQQTAALEKEKAQELEREEQIKVRDVQRQKKKDQAAKGKGRAGTILTGRGAPGKTTGSATGTATKTLLGL